MSDENFIAIKAKKDINVKRRKLMSLKANDETHEEEVLIIIIYTLLKF